MFAVIKMLGLFAIAAAGLALGIGSGHVKPCHGHGCPTTSSTTTTTGTTTTTTTPTTTTTTTLPPPTYIKVDDSTNAIPVGLSTDSNNCTLSRGELGDILTGQSTSTRCTWTNTAFSHMHRHEVFDTSWKFDSVTEQTDWTHIMMVRPFGSFGNADCADGGNHEVLFLRVWVNRTPSPDNYMLDIRGGSSLNLSDQVGPSQEVGGALDLGPIVAGQTTNLKFDIVEDYLHGAATVWENGVQIYDNRDRPLGFHYDCNRTTDISDFATRMQHGVYRGGTGAYQFTSSGFGFYVSESH